MAKTINDKLEAAKIEKEQAEARIKELSQQLKAQERTARTHRLCKRGGLVEKLIPGLIELTDEQFQTFVDKTLLTGFAEKILNGLLAQDGATVVEKPAETAQAGDSAVKPNSKESRNGAA